MWIQQKTNGKYQFFERYEDSVTGLAKTVSVTMDKNTTATRKAAQAALAAKIQKKQTKAGLYDNMTLDELLRIWVNRPGIRESSRARDLTYCVTIPSVLDGKARVNQLTANYVKTHITAAGRDDRPEFIRRLKVVMRWGYRNDYVYNVMWLDKLGTSKKKSADVSKLFLEPDELKTLLSHMTVPEWRNLTEFLALSGLRIGEAIDLNQNDVDNDMIHVTKTFGLRTKESGPTKTTAGTRDVTITPELRRCIKRIRQRKVISQTFFVDPKGRRVRYDSYRIYLENNSEKAIGRKIRPHALRHTYTSLMAAAGIPFDVIARQLGHEDSSLTRRIYFHVTKKLKEKDAELVRKVSLLS